MKAILIGLLLAAAIVAVLYITAPRKPAKCDPRVSTAEPITGSGLDGGCRQ